MTEDFLIHCNIVCKLCDNDPKFIFYVTDKGKKFHLDKDCLTINGNYKQKILNDQELYLIYRLDYLCKNCK